MAKPFRVVIEHLDPELWKWSRVEYKTVSSIVQDKDSLLFCNLKNSLKEADDPAFIQALGRTTELSIKQVWNGEDKDLKDNFVGRVCILDPRAKKELRPEDADTFDSYLFGGVLGNHPMDGRTERELSQQIQGDNVELRHLGDMQMSTDTAVRVTHAVIVGQSTLQSLEYVDSPEIELEPGYFTHMEGFRYVKQADGKPLINPELIEVIKEEDDKDLLGEF